MTKAFKTEMEYIPLDSRDEREVHLEVGYKDIKCGFIHGTVRCDTTGKSLPNVLVKAFNQKRNEHFFAVTNQFGFYALCVPPGKYLIFAMQCPPHCFSGKGC